MYSQSHVLRNRGPNAVFEENDRCRRCCHTRQSLIAGHCIINDHLAYQYLSVIASAYPAPTTQPELLSKLVTSCTNARRTSYWDTADRRVLRARLKPPGRPSFVSLVAFVDAAALLHYLPA